jgi:hypothetical protein
MTRLDDIDAMFEAVADELGPVDIHDMQIRALARSGPIASSALAGPARKYS